MTWIPNQKGLRFGKDSTVVGAGTFRVENSGNNPGASIELWVQPNRIWDSGTLLAFNGPENLSQFTLRQDQTDLSLKVVAEDEHRHPRAERLRIKDVFRRLPPSYVKSAPSFITFTSDRHGVSIYVDGALAAAKAQFPLSSKDFNGRFVVGDSPGQPDLRCLARVTH